jgi:hypothetical protein
MTIVIVIPNPFDRVREIGDDDEPGVIVFEQARVLRLPAPGQHENRLRADSLRGDNIFERVADDVRTRRINSKSFDRAFIHSCARLATIAIIFRQMRTKLHRVNPSAGAFNFAEHPRVNVAQSRFAHQPARNRGLIRRYDRDKIARRDLAERGQRAGQKNKFVPRLDMIGTIHVDHTIPIQKNRAALIHRNFTARAVRIPNAIPPRIANVKPRIALALRTTIAVSAKKVNQKRLASAA